MDNFLYLFSKCPKSGCLVVVPLYFGVAVPVELAILTSSFFRVFLGSLILFKVSVIAFDCTVTSPKALFTKSDFFNISLLPEPLSLLLHRQSIGSNKIKVTVETITTNFGRARNNRRLKVKMLKDFFGDGRQHQFRIVKSCFVS